MIYLIITQDMKYEDKPSMRLPVHGKVKTFYITCYVKTKEEAENYCRKGGKYYGSFENRFTYFKLKESGEGE